jgi:lipoic acid synthetase
MAKKSGLVTKTGIMLGLGETRKELSELFKTLAKIKLDILTIGQYLQATPNNLEVKKFYPPEDFRELKITAEKTGISHVESGPLVRSSYHADEQKSNISMD